MDKSLWKYIHVGVIKHREHSFHVKYIFIGNWNAKVGSQETPGLTGKFGLGKQNEAGQRLTVFKENTMVIPNVLFQQHKRQLYTWTSSDGQYQNQIDSMLCNQIWRSSTVSKKKKKKKKQDQELNVAQIMNPLL